MIISAIPILTENHVEELRLLRNITAYGYSHFNGHISPLEQQDWWQSMQNRVRGWLYWHMDDYAYAGFGLVRKENDGTWWFTNGVHPDYQGLGFGKFIAHDVLTRHPGPVYATTRVDNPPAIAMHTNADWERFEGTDPRLAYFRSTYGLV